MNKIMGAAAVILAGAALTSCDDINEADRLIPVERPDVARTVLVMDFTGMRCTNCPVAAETLHNSAAKYPGSVVVVGIHAKAAGDFTLPLGMDLTAPVADVYYNFFKPAALPSASIDGGAVLSGTELPKWTEQIDLDVAKTAPADIMLTPAYDATTRELTVSYDVRFNEMHAEETSILLWIIENDIIGFQLTSTGLNPEYNHNHVLRASVNGDWGEELGKGFVTEQTCSGEAKIKLDEAWNADNCQVVGFIFNTSSKAVNQAAAVDVVSKEN